MDALVLGEIMAKEINDTVALTTWNKAIENIEKAIKECECRNNPPPPPKNDPKKDPPPMKRKP